MGKKENQIKKVIIGVLAVANIGLTAILMTTVKSIIDDRNSVVLVSQDDEFSDLQTNEDSLEEKSTEADNIFGEPKSDKDKETYFEKNFGGLHIAYDINGLAGYINKNGEYVISPVYEQGKKFSEGIAPVRDAKTHLWGYIDESGKYVISPKYEYAAPFLEGYAIISDFGEYGPYGIINIKGDIVVEPEWEEVSYFKEGYAVVKDKASDLYTYFDEQGNQAFEYYKKAYLFDNGKAVVKTYEGLGTLSKDGSFDSWGYEISEMRGNSVWGDGPSWIGYVAFSDDLDSYYYWNNVKLSDGSYSFANCKGEVIAPTYAGVNNFVNGLCGAAIYNGLEYKWGYINTDFEWVVQPQFDDVGAFVNEYTYAITEYGEKQPFVIIDKKGNIIFDFKPQNGIQISTDNAYNWGQNVPLAAHQIDENGLMGNCGYVDKNYNILIPFVYDETYAFAKDGSYAAVVYEDKVGIIDKDGQWLIEPKFKSLAEDSRMVWNN